MGRGKIELKKIENASARRHTFSKRHAGLVKKAYELSVLCDAEVALMMFSSTGAVYDYASRCMKTTLERYQGCVWEIGYSSLLPKEDSQICHQDARMLRQELCTLQNMHKMYMGEELSSLCVDDLKKLELQLQVGINQVRERKNQIIMERISYLKYKEQDLRRETEILQKMISEAGCSGQIASIFANDHLQTSYREDFQPSSQSDLPYSSLINFEHGSTSSALVHFSTHEYVHDIAFEAWNLGQRCLPTDRSSWDDALSEHEILVVAFLKALTIMVQQCFSLVNKVSREVKTHQHSFHFMVWAIDHGQINIHDGKFVANSYVSTQQDDASTLVRLMY